MQKPIYLDYAATTPVDAQVAELMQNYLTLDGDFGNPSSLTHQFGMRAKHAIDRARQQVANLIHADASEIIWTSGATEAINLALKGAAELYQRKGKHIITLKTEHKAVLDTCQQLEKEGYLVTYLTPETNGLLSLEKLEAAVRPDTIIVSIMHINNETGIIQNIHAIANFTSAKGILFHVDAAQSIGKLPIDVRDTAIDMLSMNAHKVYGPKGIGALFLRRKPRIRVAAQIHGGGQEQGMRSGTLATHQIVGLAKAYELAQLEMQKNYHLLANLRKIFLQKFQENKAIVLNSEPAVSYPGIVNIALPNIKAEEFMARFPNLALSAGSACTAKGIEPSYVLRAMGRSAEQAHCALRFSFGKWTTETEVEYAANCILEIIG
jgi:cysteine desulfurase